MLKKNFVATVFLSMTFLPIVASASSSCADLQPSFIDQLSTKICSQLDMTTPTIEQLKAAKNPLMYSNPDTAGCDLGFSMPGLPAFGTNITGLDSCSIIKAITGEAISKANSAVKGSLNTALSEVKAQSGMSTGTTSINASTIVSDAIKGN